MSTAFSQLKIMGEGEWPMKADPKVTAWDKERLSLLVIHLKHTNAMPLLLSLQLLGPVRFAEAVAMIERFVFRYKTVGNGHVSPMTEVYLRNAREIREGTATYKMSTLRADLTGLVDKNVSETLFRANLAEFRYSEKRGNSHIRYFLLALEDYWDWYDKGASGVPKRKDKAVVIDFSNTTIEHVYPKSAKIADKIEVLEPLKNSVGNLTLFGPSENDKMANKPYAQKRLTLQASNIRMNRNIGENSTWTAAKVTARSKMLIDRAVRIFVP